MKIVITSKGDNLESEMDPRFGRCGYFIITDSEDIQNFKAVLNNAAQSSGGAGVKAAQIVIDEDVKAVISGNYGPKAFDSLSAGDVKLYTVKATTVKDAIEVFNSGEARLLDTASAAAHAGLKEI